MHYPIKDRKSSVILLLSYVITLFLLVYLIGSDNNIIRFGVSAILLLIHSAIFFSLGRGSTISNKITDTVEEQEDSISVGNLIPVEDESDLGELLEVEESALAEEREESSEKTPDSHKEQTIISADDPHEELEELEEAVEELESVDD